MISRDEPRNVQFVPKVGRIFFYLDYGKIPDTPPSDELMMDGQISGALFWSSGREGGVISFGDPRLSMAWPPEPPKESPWRKSPFLPILASAFTRVDSLGGSGGVRPLTNVGPRK